MKCEAAAMDAIVFDSWTDSVEPCDEIATIEVGDYFLCKNCSEFLHILINILNRTML